MIVRGDWRTDNRDIKHDSVYKVVKGKRLGSVLVKQFSRALLGWGQNIINIAEIPLPESWSHEFSDTRQLVITG